MNLIGYIKAETRYFRDLLKVAMNFKRLSAAVLVISLLLSFWTGVGIGFLIPFLQSIQGERVKFLAYLARFGITFASRAEELIFIMLVMLLAVFLQNLLQFLADYTGVIITERLSIHLRSRILEKIYFGDYLFFLRSKPGTLANIFMQQIQGYATALFNLLRFFTGLCVLVVYTALLVFISPFWTLFSSIFLIILAFFIQRISRKIHYYCAITVDKDERMTSLLLDDLNGIKVIKSCSMENIRMKEYTRLFWDRLKACLRHNQRVFSIRPGAEAILVMAVISVLIYMLKVNPDRFFAEVPFIITFMVILIRLKGSFQNASEFYVNMARYKQNVYNVEGIIKSLVAIDNGGHIKFDGFREAIRFHKVSFSYGKDRPVVRDISMEIRKGETIALVGRSGSGKTTLVLLLLGLLRPTDGVIEIDGVNLAEIDKKSYYNQVGLVSQETFLFNESLYWNIVHGDTNRFSLEDARRAAALANVDEFINSLEMGYYTLLGDKGMDLSGGERQRLGIARALVHDPGLLIMDEPTSALDSHNERAIVETIRTLCRSRQRTVLIIAHRLSTVVGADRIVVMNEGRVEAIGTHEELMTESEEYMLLYKEQLISGKSGKA